MRAWRLLALFCIIVSSLAAAGCANELRGRARVTNPLVKDNERGRWAVISRKEPRIGNTYIIAGARKPKGAGWIDEIAEIVGVSEDGGILMMDVSICGVYREEILELAKSYDYWLVFPGGRKVRGKVHNTWPMQDLSEKATGMGKYPTFKSVKGHGPNQVTQQHYEMIEVENDIEFYCGVARIEFRDEGMLDVDTAWMEFVMDGFQRKRVWHFDFDKEPPVVEDPTYEPFEPEEP